MAKLVGLFGKASGKKGDAVLAVRNGEQIMRQWNPIVQNPNTSLQQSARAKMKLMSQLSAAFRNIIAMDPIKAATPRNIFTKINYALVTAVGDKVDIQLKNVQLTNSNEGFPNFAADRSTNTGIQVSLSEPDTNDFDAVVYSSVIINEDGSMRVWDSKVVTSSNANRTFPGVLAYTLAPIVIYAYGIRYNESKLQTAFENIEGDDATFVASLIVNHSQRVAGADLTKTMGLTMAQNVTSGSSDDAHNTVFIDESTLPTITAGTTVHVGDRFEVTGRNFNLWPAEIICGYSGDWVENGDIPSYQLLQLASKTDTSLVFEASTEQAFSIEHIFDLFGSPNQPTRTLLDYRKY